MRLEFLLEEESMANALHHILPKILPEGYILNQNCFLRPHNGKTDLKRSIPKKIKVFSNFYEKSCIIIVHDQDSNDCKKLKQELQQLCSSNGNCPVLIRIACRELEAWYLGDMDAIEKVYPHFKARHYKSIAKFRNPDSCNPSNELEKIIPNFQKGYASRHVPEYMDINNNKSNSFSNFINGLKRFIHILDSHNYKHESSE